MTNKLVMKFEARTIEHLGVKMYTQVPAALAELIANAYDACANNVKVKLYDSEGNFRIEVNDDGIGMTFSEINEYFLKIGRNRRKEDQKLSCKRIPTGKKGLGKLALFGLANIITIITVKGTEKTTFTLNYKDILNWDGTDYTPKFLVEEVEEGQDGTNIILEELNRKTSFPLKDYAINLAKLFNFRDKNFKVILSKNDTGDIELNNKLKFENITSEFEWEFQEFIKDIVLDYSEKDKVKGTFFTTEKPLKPGLRGITLYANGRLINLPEFFGRAESSHFFSYLTGWLDVDFIDDFEEDLISTDRQSLNWDHEITIELREYLSNVIRTLEEVWRKERKEKRRKNIAEKTKVDITTWLSNIPEEIKENLEPIINKIDDSELSDKDQTDAVTGLHLLVPEYPLYHWRHLHSEIQDASKSDYINRDYYRAFLEAAKRYINKTREKSGKTDGPDRSLMSSEFGIGKTLSVTKNYQKPDGTEFNSDTIENIEEGQKWLSTGIVIGGRNPVSHEEIKDLRESDLFNEKDCLDGLSLLSHLYRRLENSEIN